jgi:hypothetical protein
MERAKEAGVIAIAFEKIIFHFLFVILDLSLKKNRPIRFLPMTNLKFQMKNKK